MHPMSKKEKKPEDVTPEEQTEQAVPTEETEAEAPNPLLEELEALKKSLSQPPQRRDARGGRGRWREHHCGCVPDRLQVGRQGGPFRHGKGRQLNRVRRARPNLSL